MFKVNNKNIRTTSITSFWCFLLVLTLEMFHNFFKSFYCQLCKKFLKRQKTGSNYPPTSFLFEHSDIWSKWYKWSVNSKAISRTYTFESPLFASSTKLLGFVVPSKVSCFVTTRLDFKLHSKLGFVVLQRTNIILKQLI